jgi:hypothetical protein
MLNLCEDASKYKVLIRKRLYSKSIDCAIGRTQRIMQPSHAEFDWGFSFGDSRLGGFGGERKFSTYILPDNLRVRDGVKAQSKSSPKSVQDGVEIHVSYSHYLWRQRDLSDDEASKTLFPPPSEPFSLLLIRLIASSGPGR